MHEAEVHHDRIALFVDHDVVGFEVAVDNTQGVSLLHGECDLSHGRHRLLLRERLVRLDEFLQLPSGHKFHRDVVSPVDLSHVVDRA